MCVCVCTAAQDCASLRLLGTFNSAVSVSLSLSRSPSLSVSVTAVVF